jgi:5-formyltetrahydrofolate cyclo-ligase
MTGSPEKSALRGRLLAARQRMEPLLRTDAGHVLAEAVLGAPELAGAATVAAYISIGTEPPTGQLVDALLTRGVTVLLPVLLPDSDLDWAPYDGVLEPTERGLREPRGLRLGRNAIARADVAVIPALAVGGDGRRLGRGGGSYDRALTRVGPRTWTIALLYEGELLDQVPADPHDQSVRAAATPAGIVRF